ncbi:MAG: hypothetical protein WCO56_20555 [Verrucomicrobiota bacterium]
MELTPEQRQKFLKGIYQRLADKPLKPGNPFYEPIYEKAGVEDPVALMRQHIDLNDTESLQMFSGFRGSGKTTELFRLKRDLEAQGYVVLYGDALKYLNPSQEIDISDLLIVLAGTFSDALNDMKIADIGTDDYWNRLVNYLTTTNVVLDEVGLKAGADFKLKLSTTPTFRQLLQEKLAHRIGELKRDVDRFFEDGVKAIRAKLGERIAGVVFLFDQLEQIRGTLSNEQSVIHSVERLFAQHQKLMQIPYVHMVYTVPPWLKFTFPGMGRIVMLPSIRQWNNDEQRTPYLPGREALQSLVHRRFGDTDFQTFFDGDGPEHPLADRLIAVCGGHFRDLLLLLRETVLRAKALPVTTEEIQSAIAAVRSNFLPIAIDDAKWLDQIERVRGTALPTTMPSDVNRLTRFLDTHFVLYFANGTEWYDIHPLIREEVAAIVKREAGKPGQLTT